MFDIIIKNGIIVDGSGNGPFQSDIGIKNGKITSITDRLMDESQQIIDAKGFIVAPGFIDVHSHNDLVPFMNNEESANAKISQGVTTELVGQCGLGVIPCVHPKDELWKNYIKGVVGETPKVWHFENITDYIKQISSAGLKNNFAILISHGAIKSSVMKFDNRDPNDHEILKMCEILDEAMKGGAIGISLGLQYLPGIFSKNKELVSMLKIVSHYNGITMVHLRNHDNKILNSMDEIIAIAKEANVRLHISHLRSYQNSKLGANADLLTNKVNIARQNGIDLTFDEHLYLSGSTLMTQLLPPWITEGGFDEMLKKIKIPSNLQRVKDDVDNPNTYYLGWDHYSAIAGWDQILITSLNNHEHKKYVGQSVGYLANSEGMHPIDFIIRLFEKEKNNIGIVTKDIFSLEDTAKLIKHPYQMVGSDSIPTGFSHPRMYGNYPLFIGKFVREHKILTIEEAIYKCTSLPAKTLRLNDIGEIALEKSADITIFDFNEIQGFEEYDRPNISPLGIKYVVVNGKIVLEHGLLKDDKFGKIKTW